MDHAHPRRQLRRAVETVKQREWAFLPCVMRAVPWDARIMGAAIQPWVR